MGDPLTEENEESGRTGYRTYGEIFDECFPHYLAMGMTPEQFWDGESFLKPAYRKAYALKIENDQRMQDWHAWNTGQYIVKALQAVPLFVGGLNTKGVNLPKYPEKPFIAEAEEKKKAEEKLKKAEARRKYEEDQQKLAMALLQAAFTKFNRNIEKRLKKEAEAGKTGQ